MRLPAGRFTIRVRAPGFLDEEGAVSTQNTSGAKAQGNRPARLRDVGVDEAQLPAVAEHVLGDGALATNPRRVGDAAEVMEILRAAW